MLRMRGIGLKIFPRIKFGSKDNIPLFRRVCIKINPEGSDHIKLSREVFKPLLYILHARKLQFGAFKIF